MNTYNSDDPIEGGRYAELAERLRAMRWPEPSPEARRRCWEALKRDLAAANGDAPAPVPAEDRPAAGPALVWDTPSSESRPRRHEFVPRRGGYGGALGERVAVARQPMRVAAGLR